MKPATPTVKTTAASIAGYVSAAVPMLVAYLSSLDSFGDIDLLKVLIGALAALPAAGVAGTTYRSPPPVKAPETAAQEPREVRVEVPVVQANGGRFVFGSRSEKELATCHADLVRVARRALATSPYDFTVICGARDRSEQQVLVDTGKSQTMNSRHLQRPSHALDVMVIGPDGPTWQVDPYYRAVADAFERAAVTEGVPITAGIDWTSLVDAGHIELDRAVYPDVELA